MLGTVFRARSDGPGSNLEGGLVRGGRSSPEMEQTVASTISVDDANK